MNAFDKFSLLSGLKRSKAKYEIAGIGVLKGYHWHSVVWTALTINFMYTFFL